MMSTYEQKKLMLELFYLKPGLNIPEKLDISDIRDIAQENEIKALKRSNERLLEQVKTFKEQNKELENYAHTVAHNLKNPLSALIITAEAVQEISDLSKEELLDYMQQIRSTAYEMNDTIDNLLLLSEVRKVDAPIEPVQMSQVVRTVMRRLNFMLEEYQGKIVTPKTWHTAMGYEPWLEEVWVNYLSNAIKYGGRPPVIRLGSTEMPDGEVRFWVLDNGYGIPAEARANLFSPFNQFSEKRRPGHGLGLSIVRQIIEKLGGTVGVESKAGKGSLFYFTLPAWHHEAEKGLEKASISGM